MGDLSPDDVRRWNLFAIEQIFDVATGRSETLKTMAGRLQEVQQSLADWGGDSGDAFRQEITKAVTQAHADAAQSAKVASTASKAEEDVRQCVSEMHRIDGLARANRWAITSDWKVDIGNTGEGRGNDLAFVGAWQELQDDLTKLHAKADTTDEELAATMRAAVGDGPIANEVPRPPPAPPAGGYTPVTAAQLREIVPELSQAKADEMVGPLNDAMRQGGMNTPVRQAAFISQIAVESDRFSTYEEYASGQEYEGRCSGLGNCQPGDGPRYKGRGVIQLTGRNNYDAAGKALGVDLVDNPELAATPEWAFKTAVWYWDTHDGNAVADTGDIRRITRMVNGGDHGLSARTEYYNKGLQVLDR